MNIVTPSVEICKERGLKKIELIAKVCTKKEHKITETSALKFVKDRVSEGHNAILGHEYEYFNISNLNSEHKRDLLIFNPYIHISNNGDYMAVSWRSLLDMKFHSRRNYKRSNLIIHEEPTYDIINALWILSEEFRSVFNITTEALLDNMVNRKNIREIKERITKIEPDIIQSVAPEIFVVTIKFITDRGIGNEIVRHAEITPMQESTRWCDYSKGKGNVSFINPFEEDSVHQSLSDSGCDLTMAEVDLCASFATSESYYNELRQNKITAQIARNVLPLGLKTEMYMTGTLEQWFGENIEQQIGDIMVKEKKGFILQRTAKQTHPQLRPLAKQVEELLKDINNII